MPAGYLHVEPGFARDEGRALVVGVETAESLVEAERGG
jgi:hypothetical protein